MSSQYPSFNDREFDLLKKLTNNSAELADGSGIPLTVAEANLLYAKLGLTTASGLTLNTSRLLGRATAGVGAVEEITLGAGLSFVAGALVASDVAAVWGSITGTLSNQTDLQTALNAKQATGNYITALTGDATASGPGSVALTLATVNGSPGTFGSATTSLTATVNGKGLITALSSQTVTPAVGSITGLGTGVATALAANIGSAGAFAILGTNTFTGAQVVSGASFGLSGNISSAAWTTSGVRYKNVAATLTDTTSSGTVATAYTDVWGGNTIAASSATTFTNYFTTYFNAAVVGTNVTFTNVWALGADSIKIGTSNQLTVSTSGVLSATSPVFVTPALGTPASGVGTNLTGTASSLTSGITNALASATTTVNVSSATAPTANQVLTATSGTAATWQTPAAGGTTLNGVTAATGAVTIASGNNTGIVWNWANTTDSTVAFNLGETTAATNGTSTGGIPNQVLLKLNTLATSTQSPFQIYLRGLHVLSISPTARQILAHDGTAAAPIYAFSSTTGSGLYLNNPSIGVSVSGTQAMSLTATGIIFNGPGTAAAPIYTNGSVHGIFLPTSGQQGVGISVSGLETFRFLAGASQASIANNNPTSYAINVRHSRGTVAAPTVITTADDLHTISGYGYVGATNTYLEATRITSSSTGTIADATTGIGGTIKFYTTLAGTDTAPQLNTTFAGGSVPTVAMVGKVTTYNNIATAGAGAVVVRAAGRVTAQSAANASISTYTLPAVDGSFEVSANMNVTASTTLVTTLTCTYTDESNTARTLIFPVTQLSGSFIAAGAITTTGAWESPVLHIRCKASTAITILTSAGTFTGVTYTAEGIIKQTN